MAQAITRIGLRLAACTMLGRAEAEVEVINLIWVRTLLGQIMSPTLQILEGEGDLEADDLLVFLVAHGCGDTLDIDVMALRSRLTSQDALQSID